MHKAHSLKTLSTNAHGLRLPDAHKIKVPRQLFLETHQDLTQTLSRHPSRKEMADALTKSSGYPVKVKLVSEIARELKEKGFKLEFSNQSKSNVYNEDIINAYMDLKDQGRSNITLTMLLKKIKSSISKCTLSKSALSKRISQLKDNGTYLEISSAKLIIDKDLVLSTFARLRQSSRTNKSPTIPKVQRELRKLGGAYKKISLAPIARIIREHRISEPKEKQAQWLPGGTHRLLTREMFTATYNSLAKKNQQPPSERQIQRILKFALPNIYRCKKNINIRLAAESKMPLLLRGEPAQRRLRKIGAYIDSAKKCDNKDILKEASKSLKSKPEIVSTTIKQISNNGIKAGLMPLTVPSLRYGVGATDKERLIFELRAYQLYALTSATITGEKIQIAISKSEKTTSNKLNHHQYSNEEYKASIKPLLVVLTRAAMEGRTTENRIESIVNNSRIKDKISIKKLLANLYREVLEILDKVNLCQDTAIEQAHISKIELLAEHESNKKPPNAKKVSEAIESYLKKFYPTKRNIPPLKGQLGFLTECVLAEYTIALDEDRKPRPQRELDSVIQALLFSHQTAAKKRGRDHYE